MKEVKATLIALCVMGVCMFDSVALASEAFFTNPGSRAMSMGSAFTAQADDSTAIWYNPAGLYQTGYHGDFTLEVGAVPSISDSGQYTTDEARIKYVGLKTGSGKNGWSIGIAYFEPYKLATIIPEKVSPTDTKAIGRVDVEYRQFSFAVAGGVGDRLSLGIGLDSLAFSTVNAKNYGGDIGALKGVGLDIGGLYKIVAGENFNMKVGAVYRTKSKLEFEDSSSDCSTIKTTKCKAGDIIVQYLPGRPESRGIGLNISFPVSPLYFNFNAASEQTLWSQAYTSKVDATGSDYQKSMLGAEVTMAISESSSVAIRFGTSKATPEDTSKYATINSVAYGMGLTLVDHFVIDIGAENKTFSGDSNKYSLWSMSGSYQF